MLIFLTNALDLKTLGLQKGATMVEIKKAFRALSLKHHPDKGGQTEIFQTVSPLSLLPVLMFSHLYLSSNPCVAVFKDQPGSFGSFQPGIKICLRYDRSIDPTNPIHLPSPAHPLHLCCLQPGEPIYIPGFHLGYAPFAIDVHVIISPLCTTFLGFMFHIQFSCAVVFLPH